MSDRNDGEPMARAGRELEKLVALLEEVLAPLGAEIKSPDFFVDRITGERREVDVSIRTAASPGLIVICECRDRVGAQDVTWIEQLAQKRIDIGATKTIAVSTSGFTSPARVKAKFLHIETRVISEISAEDMAHWFRANSLILSTYHADIRHVSIDVASKRGEAKVAPNFVDVLMDPERRLSAEVFRCQTDGKQCSIATMWDWVHAGQYTVINAGIPTSGERVRRTIAANFKTPGKRFEVPMDDGPREITRLTFVVDLWCEYSEEPISRRISYAAEDKCHVQTVEWRVSVNERDYELRIHRDAAGRTSATGDIDEVHWVEQKQ